MRWPSHLPLFWTICLINGVVFVVGENNLRSQKALEKIGAHFLRRMDEPEPERVGGARVVFAIERAASPTAEGR